jgi:uncharacterized OsmC-like protein
MIFDYPDGELQSADRCDAGRKQQARARGVDRSVRTTLMAQPIVPLRPPLATRSNAGVQGRTDSTAIRILRCRTVVQGRLHQLNYIRDLPPQPVLEDEPEGLSGEAIAPNASEALLAAFGSCLAVGIHASALVQRIPIRELELDISADIDTTSVWGAGDSTPKTIGFATIRVSVRLEADAPRAALEALVRHATLWSPVANTLHNPVHLDVTLAVLAT